MDPESKKLLEQTLELEQDNNKMLRSMRRSMLWGRFMTIVYWLIIIGISVGAFYFIQPYFDKVLNLYNQISGAQEKINGTDAFKSFIKK